MARREGNYELVNATQQEAAGVFINVNQAV